MHKAIRCLLADLEQCGQVHRLRTGVTSAAYQSQQLHVPISLNSGTRCGTFVVPDVRPHET